MRLEDLRNRDYGETIWVLGSGPSLNFVDPTFFAGKITVSTNTSAKTIGVKPDYGFSHYHSVAREIMTDTGTVVTIAKDTLSQKEWDGEQPENLVLAEQDSYHPPGASWNPLTTHPPRKDSLAYGSSSLHGAMHLAGWLGAKSIILVGADCGTIDGRHRVEGYPDGDKHWALYNQHHKLMKTWLHEQYGTETYSLNPFINLNLEGHRFQGP